MSEAVERIKAGEERAGQACGFCKAALSEDDDAAICAECASVHHELCWDHALGCSKADCVNAPLKRLDAPAPGAAAPAKAKRPEKKRQRADMKVCVDCGEEMPLDEEICDSCHAINTPDGLYHGPKTNAPGARDSLILGLVGIVICGPILGMYAIKKSQAAKEAIRVNPRYGGEGLATAGFILGILDLVIWGLGLIMRLGKL